MDTIRVADCMSHQFVSFSSEMSVVEAASELVKNELLGGPVTDSTGRLCGWVSEQDCLAVVTQVIYYSERVATVADIMRADVLTAKAQDSVVDLATQMQQQKPKIYPVVDSANKVIGVISRRLILREMCLRITSPVSA
mgnify:CR=1 FL=1